MSDPENSFFYCKSSDVGPKNSIIDYFHEENKAQLTQMASELSDEAHDFFDASINSLLGHMPEGLAVTTVTINRQMLNELLFSAMVTGYLTKSVEDKVDLERVWRSDKDSDNFPNFESFQ